MYCNDADTGRTLFVLPTRVGMRKVMLEGFSENQKFRVPMRRKARNWFVRLAIMPGWFVYRFEVDGRAKWDRDVGKCKSADGRACSLAVISGARRAMAV
jgi:hypothetical protein